ncbi:ATP-binding protein [Halobacteria archaeon AArc-m2/3/4]|uniref:histidine kinase n=1 Tax=Natronoglomus mannanivorans TaxID=2979990 RepID=A0ABT2QEA7_9EURY|nr:ATP-binding protein [Halobacteria archaeon AArc-m2/3/4]
MVLEQSTLQIAYTVSVVTSLALCWILWHHRRKTGAVVLLCYIFAGVVWSATQLANITIDDPAVSLALLRIWFLGIAFGSVALFVFALQYTGREQYLGSTTYLALSIYPVYLFLFVFVDPGEYFFETIESDPTTVLGIVPEYGIAIVPHLIAAYSLTAVSVLMFVDMYYRTPSLYRGQSLAVIGGSLLPAAGTLPLVFGLVEFDPAPIVIPIASGLFTVAIVRYRLIDLVPIARDRVLETVNDGVFVIDRGDRLVDVNPEGRRILRTVDTGDQNYIGRNFRSLLEETDLQQQYDAITASREETTFEVSIGTSHLQVTVTPIDDGHDRHVGWLAIVHDVTERKRHEDRLERQNERLDQFASLVSHDLRNPLTVANGYLELARETDDADDHLEEVAQAHERMETIIDDVLTIAREGADVTDPEPVDLEALAERAWNGVATGDATLDVHSSASIRADPDRLQRLLENLFRNAVEHGSTSSQNAVRSDDDRTDSRAVAVESGLVVRVGIDRDESATGLTLFVADTGPGIPPDQREQVFEAGYTTDDDGTGFGLSIVAEIARAHGWSVRATESESESGGARFEFGGVEPVPEE